MSPLRAHAQAHSGARGDILALLHALPATATGTGPTREVGLSAPELADRLGLHVTTVRFHLDQLLASGQVAVGAAATVPGRRGRPPRTYAAATAPLATVRDDLAYRMLAELLTDQCGASPTTTPEQAGREWAERNTRTVLPGQVPDQPAPAATRGEWIGKVGQVVEFLHSWGYDPAIHIVEGGRNADISLDHCPFQDMARRRPEVVCAIHVGLIRGALDVLGEAGTGVNLDPFVTPTSCRVRLAAAAPQEESAR